MDQICRYDIYVVDYHFNKKAYKHKIMKAHRSFKVKILEGALLSLSFVVLFEFDEADAKRTHVRTRVLSDCSFLSSL